MKTKNKSKRFEIQYSEYQPNAYGYGVFDTDANCFVGSTRLVDHEDDLKPLVKLMNKMDTMIKASK